MKKLLYSFAFILSVFLIIYSCSADEDTTPPPQVQQPTPEPEPEISQFTLTVTAGEGGTVSTEGGTYDEGTEVTISATPEEGYEFVGWEGSDSTEASLTLNIEANISIEANFEKSIVIIQLDQLKISQPSIVGFNDNTYYHETDQYIISKKGWLGMTPEESHNGGFYGNSPTPPGVFLQFYSQIFNPDLNGDGLEDIILSTSFSPHTIESTQTIIPFFSLINNGDGTFKYSQEYFSESFERSNPGSYRSVVSDLNGDGKDDFILGMRGKPAISVIDGGTDASSETPILAISNENGYYDNSQNLVGIYPGTISNENDWDSNNIADFVSDRGFALGDFDGDGDDDLFMTEKILTNDGSGNFSISEKQLRNEFIPRLVDPPYSNTYEAHSNDFNNDGFDDLLIVPDSGFIVRNGGSAWIAMSNGTSNLSEWDKVMLPDPIYVNNAKLNDIESTDINNDGFIDLIIATTRDNPYYIGKSIQLLKNNSGNGFLDITDSNMENQLKFDQWHGEGDLILKDVNNDSVLDIIHHANNFNRNPIRPGTSIFINNNGYFEIYDVENKIPYTAWNQLEGYGQFIDNPYIENDFSLNFAFPVNINKDDLIDFIAIEREVGNDERVPNIVTNVFYTIQSK